MPEAIIFNLRNPELLMHNERGYMVANTDSSVLFERVFKSEFKNLHSYACSILKDEASAEEIVQQVFYKLWEKRDTFNELQSVPAYLYRSVHNECLNLLKHSKVRAAHVAHSVYTGKDADIQDDQVTLKELQRKIDKAINELPEQCRTIFQMSRFEDLKYKEIADRMGLSVKTIENQMGKALRTLRVQLSEFLPVLIWLFINVLNLIK